jgi:SAM-dependent methyltransferase
VRRLANALRAALPTAYWRGRNAVALAEFYASNLHRRLRGPEPYDEKFWDFHDTGDWVGFARAVVDYVHPRSVADIGCGHGLTLEGLARVDSTLRLRGFDDSEAALRRARKHGLSVDRLDIVRMSRTDAAALARELGSFDAVVCLEVAEHLPPWHSGKLLTIVTAADRLVFSAAHPLQGGRLHVNEQPAAHWIEKLAGRGFRVSADDEQFRQRVAALELPLWYHQNVHLFERARG